MEPSLEVLCFADLSCNGITRSEVSDFEESPKMSRKIDIRASSEASKATVTLEKIEGT